MTFQRNKVRRNRAARQKNYHRGGGRPARHKAARSRKERKSSFSASAEGVTLEELEHIVARLDGKVIDAWKGLGDVSPKQARAEYVALGGVCRLDRLSLYISEISLKYWYIISLLHV